MRHPGGTEESKEERPREVKGGSRWTHAKEQAVRRFSRICELDFGQLSLWGRRRRVTEMVRKSEERIGGQEGGGKRHAGGGKRGGGVEFKVNQWSRIVGEK